MNTRTMDTHMEDSEIHEILQEVQRSFLGKALLISRCLIVVLTMILAVLSLWTVL